MDIVPNDIKRIEDIPWKLLQEMAIKELSTIPENEHIVFEGIFKLKWTKFQQMILSLAEKSYDEISPFQHKMAMLGDFSSEEILELSVIATVNSRLKSAKVEYWLVCRSLHTKR